MEDDVTGEVMGVDFKSDQQLKAGDEDERSLLMHFSFSAAHGRSLPGGLAPPPTWRMAGEETILLTLLFLLSSLFFFLNLLCHP